jgi:hypothetical protein
MPRACKNSDVAAHMDGHRVALDQLALGVSPEAPQPATPSASPRTDAEALLLALGAAARQTATRAQINHEQGRRLYARRLRRRGRRIRRLLVQQVLVVSTDSGLDRSPGVVRHELSDRLPDTGAANPAVTSSDVESGSSQPGRARSSEPVSDSSLSDRISAYSLDGDRVVRDQGRSPASSSPGSSSE